jgi:hypothetical protein
MTFHIRQDEASAFEFGVWRLGESVEKFSTSIQHKDSGLSSCDLLTDSGSGLEKIRLRDIRGEKEPEPSPPSTENCSLELIVV